MILEIDCGAYWAGRMNLEVDQSRKVEQSGPITLAFSNHECGSIQVSAKVKRRVLRLLRERGHKRQTTINMVFALLAILLHDVIQRAGRVIIDDEYTGHQGSIKNQMLQYLRKLGVQTSARVITFGLVGKHSPAHDPAIQVFRRKKKPDCRVTFEELWSLLA